MSHCIDLRRRFAQWKTRMSDDHETGHRLSPWIVEVACEHGSIYPWGGDWLCAYTDKPQVGARLRKLACAEEHQYAHFETIIRFHVADAAAVFGVMKPYRRRRLSEAHRRKLRAGWERAHACRKPPRPSDRPPRERRKRDLGERGLGDERPAEAPKPPSEK